MGKIISHEAALSNVWSLPGLMRQAMVRIDFFDECAGQARA